MAASLTLAGVLPNNGTLLHDGDIRNTAPQELRLKFSESDPIDATTLGAIEILRSGGDGVFASADVTSDLNTNGAVAMRFSAVTPGQAGNGLTMVFTSSNRGSNPAPGISVSGQSIFVDLNSNGVSATTAFDLRNALNTNPASSQLVRAAVTAGNAFTVVGNRTINYSPLTLNGANTARATTTLGRTGLQLEFKAVATGAAGNGLQIAFAKQDFGGAGAPVVTVSGRTISILLNSNVGNESTAQDVVTAVNNNLASRALVRAFLNSGNPLTKVGNSTALNGLTLGGANDVAVTPGYIGIGDSPYEVVVRFAEELPDDRYQIAIRGTGASPLRDAAGHVLNDGAADTRLSFELDLGAKIVSIVPQPISRDSAGKLVQAKDQIDVYFNDDDLNRASAENPDFYQLILTGDTVRNTDDVVFYPTSVTYNAVQDRAILKFAGDLDALAGSPLKGATWRLRIGTDEAQPVAPAHLDPGVDAASTFTGALDLAGSFDTGAVLVASPGSTIVDGQTITIRGVNGTTTVFEFDDVLNGPFGTTGSNVGIPYVAAMTADEVAQQIADLINLTGALGVTATAVGSKVHLDGDSTVTLDPTLRGVHLTTQALIVSGSIDNGGQAYTLDFPGGLDEPGHRDVPVESHLLGGADGASGISVIPYNFQDEYGFDPLGNILHNAITEIQKQRAREVFEIYSSVMGVQFIETPTLGFTIVTGDMRALDPTIPTGPGGVIGLAGGGTAIMDLQDFAAGDDLFGDSWFTTAMHEIGHLLGLGHTYDLPATTVQGSDPTGQQNPAGSEPIYPGAQDIVHGQHLFRPESKDIDLYRFNVTEPGEFSAETFAERQTNPSLLNTVLLLYKENADGTRELLSRNDDYFGSDSFLTMQLTPGTYYLGVSASGNSQYNPEVEDSGLGGLSEGAYDLRLNFRGNIDSSIVDADNAGTGASPLSQATPLDGDGDGTPGGVNNFWFRTQTSGHTFYVDKMAANGGNGSLATPYNTISAAISRAQPGDIVRVVGNGGADNNPATLADNKAYEIGFSALGGRPLADGTSLEVPKGVTLMIDQSAVIKLRRARVGVGSSNTIIDRSAGALQVLGAPRLFDASGNVVRDSFNQPVAGSVYFTSLHDRTIGVGTNPDTNPPAVASGDWGGLMFRSDFDEGNSSRFSWEDQGIFLNYVNNADIRYGGGNVVIDGVGQNVAPIQMEDSRPTITYNTITRSLRAAMSASPNSSLETNFVSPDFQLSGEFSSDYDRVGPQIQGNHLVDNSLNGLFIKVQTPAGSTLRPLTVSGRWDDASIVHILQENLVVAGNPGGPILETDPPPVELVTLTAGAVGAGTLKPGDYSYRVVFVDAQGNEGPPSDATRTLTVDGNPAAGGGAGVGSILLDHLPTATGSFVARRIYRSDATGAGGYELIAEINTFVPSFLDTGATIGGALAEAPFELRARPDARLAIDPNVVVKLGESRIEVGLGAQLIAEGDQGADVVFTSIHDQRYGAGGTFDTNRDGATDLSQPGNWGGIYAGYESIVSIENAVLAYGGGAVRTEGAFRGFNVIEGHQADLRVAHATIERSGDGTPAGVVNDDRFGRSPNGSATIFVRSGRTVLLDNIIQDNGGAAVSIDVNSLNAQELVDYGSSRGAVEIYGETQGNRGALVKDNRLARNAVDGMAVRGGTLLTEGVWDDVSIVHVLTDTVAVPDFHTFGGLRLESSDTASLVVKLQGQTAGFTAAGRPLDIEDRIGGSLYLLGNEQHPVVLTSAQDCTVGASLMPDGSLNTDTLNTGACAPVQFGQSGSVIIDGGDRDDHGFALAGLDNVFGTADDVNQDGWLFIEQMLQFTTQGSRKNALNDILAIGVNGGFAQDAIESAAVVLGLNVTFATGATISTINFDQFNVLYVPSDEFNTFGGISDADLALLTARKNDVQAYVNSGGSLVALTEESATAPYAWLNLPDPFAISNFVFNTALRKTPAAIAAGFTISDIDLTNGTPYHNSFVGPPGFNGLVPFVLDEGFDFIAGNADDQVITLGLPSGSFGLGANPANPGDWQGITVGEYANDRNVDMIDEHESHYQVGINDITDRAEHLGQLAPSEKSGDETLRLGFQINGLLSATDDIDVFSFDAQAGTQVVFDIDRTTHSLDTVLELVDANGNVLVRSDNSGDEINDPSLIYKDPAVILPGTANPLRISPNSPPDLWTTNPRDAGMVVVLPGQTGQVGRYYLRVRSKGADIAVAAGGLSAGEYQLQVRLGLVDEIPGTTFRHADIRYAATGINVVGQPIHSPLAGEVAEDTTVANDTIATAQQVGNLMQTDQAVLNISGRLANSGDVDIYRFEVNYASTQLPVTAHVPVTIDLDYADGLARANTVLTLFDNNGNLVATNRDSNIAEDRPRPTTGSDLTDLTRGSVGALDPFIGPIELPNGFYYLAVTSDARVSGELNQFTSANPANPLVRLEPNNALVRIAEDHISFSGGSTAADPILPELVNASSIVPYFLGDTTLYVSRDTGATDVTEIRTIDPFTGALETTVGSFGFDVGDIDFRANGQLLAYRLDLETFPASDADAGNYLLIDTATGAATNLGDDNIETYNEDLPANPGNSIRSNPVNNNRVGDGIHFQAIEFGVLGQNGELGFAVGSRPAFSNPPGVTDTENILYQFNPNTGVAFSAPAPDRTGNGRHFGAGTQIVERGALITDADPFGTAGAVLIAEETTDFFNGFTTPLIVDGTTFTVDNGFGGTTTFEFVSGPEITGQLFPQLDPPQFLRDGDLFQIDGVNYEIDTGEVFVVTAANGNFVTDGQRFTITDNATPPVTRTFEFDDGTGPVIQGGVIPVPFNVGMTRNAIVAAIVNAINGVPAFNVVAQALPTANNNFNNRISLINATAASNASTAMTISGAAGSQSGALTVRVEETDDTTAFFQGLVATFNNVPGISFTFEGDRGIFFGASTGSFTQLVNRGAVVDLGHDDMPSNGTFVAIPFAANDTAAQVAQRIATAINGAGIGVLAGANNTVVTMSGLARFTAADLPLQLAGAAPGGDITGMAIVTQSTPGGSFGRLFAVSDAGGLYEILNPEVPRGAVLDYIDTATDLLGIQFVGLAAPPTTVEGGFYNQFGEEILFGIDVTGELWAFNVRGELQPVFVDGQTHISTGAGAGVNGISFGPLNQNPWTVSNSPTNHTADPGHGLNAIFDGSRLFDTPGQTSLKFSANQYNSVGGAYGAIESLPFSLEGYTSADQPVMYFNYFLETENRNADLNTPQFMRDSFRVYVAGDDGNWTLVATNNSDRGPGFFDDEFDDLDFTDNIDADVQELFDVGDNGAPNSWRQARVPLAPFAGQDNLRIRFEFSSAGTMNFGDTFTTGSELRAISGDRLRDGQTFSIDGDLFEFELGPTIVAPTGSDIADGETFTIHGKVFEFDTVGNGVTGTNIPIIVSPSLSADSVAQLIRAALTGVDYSLTADLVGTESNDQSGDAVDTGLVGGADLFHASGFIGDNPTLNFSPGLDVDLLSFDMLAGDTIDVVLDAFSIGTGLDATLRLFDDAGNELAIDTGTGATDPALTFTAITAGKYYLGISGDPNDSYDALSPGFGTAGSTGAYDVTITVNGFTGVLPRLNDNRVQLDGASKVSKSAGAAVVIDGAAGTIGIPVVVNSDMTDLEVAAAIRQSLADQYAGGVLQTIKAYNNVVKVIGHDITDQGPLGANIGLEGDQFGTFGGRSPGSPGPDRFQNNGFDGAYIDDIIIGFAERGELATGAAGASNFINNPLLAPNQILVGDYSVEIRRASAFGISQDIPPLALLLTDSYDTNDRFNGQAVTLVAPAASQILDGQTFTLSDGVNQVTFEYVDVNTGRAPTQGNVAILFDPSAPGAQGGVTAEPDYVVAARIRDAINSTPVRTRLNILAGSSDGGTGSSSTSNRINLYGATVEVGAGIRQLFAGDLSATAEDNDTLATATALPIVAGRPSAYTASGNIGDNPALIGFNAPLDVDLLQVQLAGGSTIRIDIDSDSIGTGLDSIVRLFDVAGNELAFNDDGAAPGEFFSFDSYLEFTVPASGTYYIGVSGYDNFTYDPLNAATGTAGSTGDYTINVEVDSGGIQFTRFTGLTGDSNHDRKQGQLIIESTTVTNARDFGIDIGSGARSGPTGDIPHQGPARLTREVNTQQLVPGVVVRNNLLIDNGQGGIRYSGDTGGGQPASVPFGRIVNNTIYGGGAGDIGIRVENNASPTLLNNIVANLGVGISMDASSAGRTVIGGTLYQDNGTNSTGTLGQSALVLAAGDPLFMDAASGNFYLAPNSLAIDSSIEVLSDRTALLSVKGPLGISPSPIKAPLTDALGQLRGAGTSPGEPGTGSDVFIDRGAIDRVDFAGPTAVLVSPRDNDSLGVDLNPAETQVELSTGALSEFVIQLVDGVEPVDPSNGVGVDDRTVTSQQVSVFRDDVLLTEGVDYRFRYDTLNNVIRLTPIAGLWDSNHVYRITLANSDQVVITAPDGTQVMDGENFTLTDTSGNSVRFEYDSGFHLQVRPTLALQVPKGGGGLGGVTDRETIVVSDGTTTATLELDNNGSVSSGAIRVIFTPTDTDDQVATAIVAALQQANIGLAPKVLGNGMLHVGAGPTYTVDITGAPSLTSTGSVTGGVREGDTLVIDDGTKVTTFEFDVLGNGVTSGNTKINTPRSLTSDEIADAIVTAIDAGTSLSPVHLGGGSIQVGGTLVTTIDATNSTLTLTGQPGVQSEFGIRVPSQAGQPFGITDTMAFSIGDGIHLPVVFEFDNNGSAVPGRTVISFNATTTLDQLTNRIVTAIASVGLGLSPRNAGGGVIILDNDTPAHFFNAQTSNLFQVGIAGQAGSVPIPFINDASYTATIMAQAIAVAVNNSSLQGVVAVAQGSKVALSGVDSVTGIVDAFVSGIADLAGNVLKSNQGLGTTEFTIVLGDGFDYGDAPIDFGAGYKTLESQDGARHHVDASFHLGASIDIDVDGQPNSTATGDDINGRSDEDGVVMDAISRGYDTSITVTAHGITASRPGFLDAWIDYNRDGVFDSTERIATSLPLVEGDNVFTVAIPLTASLGNSFARFRLSSTGGLGPNGEAPDGEVEDYQVSIAASAWNNANWNIDVVPDNKITILDILKIVEFLQIAGSPVMPKDGTYTTPGGITFTSPPYIDVDGDNRIRPADIIPILNYLIAEANAEGEGATIAAAGSDTGDGAEGEAGSAWQGSPLLVGMQPSATNQGSGGVREITFGLVESPESELDPVAVAVADSADGEWLDTLADDLTQQDDAGDSEHATLDDLFAAWGG